MRDLIAFCGLLGALTLAALALVLAWMGLDPFLDRIDAGDPGASGLVILAAVAGLAVVLALANREGVS